MSDAGLIATLIGAFAFAIFLVQVLSRLIDFDGRDDSADEPPGTGGRALSANQAAPDGQGQASW